MSFSSGFLDGIDPGLRLGEAMVQKASRKGIKEANDIFAKMSTMGPGQDLGAVPTEALGAVPVGYTGTPWDDEKSYYLAAMRNVTDPDIYKKMEDRMVQLEHSKVMEHGNRALAAIQSGNMQEAQRAIAGVSYFTDPGHAPTSIVTPDGNIVIHDDEGGAPDILTPDNLADFLHRSQDFEGWRDFTLDKEKHYDNMAFKEKQLTARTLIANAELALNEKRTNAAVESSLSTAAWRKTQTDTAAAMAPVELAQKKLTLETAQNTLDRAKELHTELLSEKDREVAAGRMATAQAAFDEMITNPEQFAADTSLEVEGFGEDTVVVGGKAAQVASEISAGTNLRNADFTALKAKNREMLESRRELRLFADALMQGLLTEESNPTKMDALMGRLAFHVATDRTNNGDFDYNPDNNTVTMGGTEYLISDDMAPTLKSLWGDMVGADSAGGKSEGGGASGVIPEPGG